MDEIETSGSYVSLVEGDLLENQQPEESSENGRNSLEELLRSSNMVVQVLLVVADEELRLDAIVHPQVQLVDTQLRI